MFITLEHKNIKSYVRLDDIIMFQEAVSGQDLGSTSYFFRLRDGSEHDMSKEGFEKLHAASIECEETLEELPTPVNHKPSEIGAFLTQLHQLCGGRGEAKLTTDRKARLIARMKDFSKEDLIRAATNLGNDEFMQGGNDSGKRWGTIDYLIRTSRQVNQYLDDQPAKKQTGMFG